MNFSSSNDLLRAGVTLNRLGQAKMQYVAITNELSTRESLELQIGLRATMLADLRRLRVLLASRLLVQAGHLSARRVSRQRGRTNRVRMPVLGCPPHSMTAKTV